MAQPLSPKLDWEKANPLWASALNPVVANPLLQGTIIQNISLIVGNNIVAHKLNRLQIGWFIIDQQGSAAVYRSQPFNNTTLVLNSSAAVTISLWMF